MCFSNHCSVTRRYASAMADSQNISPAEIGGR